MRIKPWMEVNFIQNNDYKAENWIGDDALIGSQYKKIRSLKRARKVAKAHRIGWKARWRRQRKQTINEIYRYLRPGSKVNACFHGNMVVHKVQFDLDQYGYISELRVPGPPDSKYAACDWGNCVSPGWEECIYNEDQTEIIGWKLFTDGGTTIKLYTEGQ